MPTQRARSPLARWRGSWRRMWRFGCSRRATSRTIARCASSDADIWGEFSELFVQVVRVAREMGLARFGKLSVDGTKVRANASKRKAMSYERMGQEEVRLQAQIEALLRKAGAVDAEEDEHWGEDFRGDELPQELQRREKRLAAIQAAKARLEAAQRARDDEHGRERAGPQSPGRAALQARLRRARAEGAEQFHRSREPDHEDQQRGIPAVLQRADGGRWGAPDHRRD